jgi:hypothetical protein
MKKLLFISVFFIVANLVFAQTTLVDDNLLRQIVDILLKIIQSGQTQETQPTNVLPEKLVTTRGYLVQINNLKITEIETIYPKAGYKNPETHFFAVKDTRWQCRLFESEESRRSFPCPLSLRKKISEGEELEIQITDETTLLLANRQGATLQDFQIGDKINVYGYTHAGKLSYIIDALIVRKITSAPKPPKTTQQTHIPQP